MTKKELRNVYRQKRLDISEQERIKLDDLLLIQFQKLHLPDAEVLLTYYPMPHTAEPDTHIFSRYLHHMVPGLQTAYPVTDFSTATMNAFAVTDDTDFVENAFRIAEPVSSNFVNANRVDIVFVPMLICDAQGNRVGYGKGFYDRYLAQCRQDVIKIGFSYFEPIEAVADAHEFDIPLSYCITPKRIYEFE